MFIWESAACDVLYNALACLQIIITPLQAAIKTNINNLDVLTNALEDLVLTSHKLSETLSLADGKYDPGESIHRNKNTKDIRFSFNKLPIQEGFDKSIIHFNENFVFDVIKNEASGNITKGMPAEKKTMRKKRESIKNIDHNADTDKYKNRERMTNHLDIALKETLDKRNDYNKLKNSEVLYNIGSKYNQENFDNVRPFANDSKKFDAVPINMTNSSADTIVDILSKYLEKEDDELLEEISEDVQPVENSFTTSRSMFSGVPVKFLLPLLRMKTQFSNGMNNSIQSVKNAAGGVVDFLDAGARGLSSSIMSFG